MKHLYLLILIGIISFPLQAQQIQIDMGNKQEKPRGSTLQNIIGADASGIYALRYKRTGYASYDYFIEKYDPKTYQLLVSNKVNISPNESDINWEYLILYHGKLVAFVSEYNFEYKKTILYHAEIDKQTLKPTGSLVSLAAVDSESPRNKATFNLAFSPDNDKLLIVQQPSYIAQRTDRVGFLVLNRELEIQWQKDLDLPFRDQDFVFEDFLVDNDGNAFLQARIFDSIITKRDKDNPNYSYIFLGLNNQGEDLMTTRIELDDYFVSDLKMSIKSKHELLAAGFYSEKGVNYLKGTFSLGINSLTGEITGMGIQNFSSSLMTDLSGGERKINRGNEELVHYDLNEIYTRPDGGAILVAEQFYIQQDKQNGQTAYYYNDIIVTSINPDNTIAWSVHVPKRQVTHNDGGYYSSFVPIVKGDIVYLLYNDHPDNVQSPAPTEPVPFTGNKATMMLAAVDGNGAVHQRPLLSNGNSLVCRPGVCQAENNEIIIYGEESDYFSLGRLIF